MQRGLCEPQLCWRREPLPAPSCKERVDSSWRMEARCSWMKSAILAWSGNRKLLRAIQEQEFERLGSARTIQVNVRMIAATHRDLAAMIREQEPREDLFYRFNVFPIEIPPLRERREDILLLVNQFVAKFAQRWVRTSDSSLEMRWRLSRMRRGKGMPVNWEISWSVA